jgi:hypothetical protein
MSISVDDDFFTMVTGFCLLRGVNRSMFIRESVKTAMATAGLAVGVHSESELHRSNRPDGMCNPFSNRGRCGICYQEGI